MTDGIIKTWVLVMVQHNVAVVNDAKDPTAVLDDAWHFLETYMTWEDINIDFK
jgi:outer membrane PBP1 activator LpoA protein